MRRPPNPWSSLSPLVRKVLSGAAGAALVLGLGWLLWGIDAGVMVVAFCVGAVPFIYDSTSGTGT